MANKLSPMMSFYLSLKENYKDCIVLFRLGDFYEMFFEDAIKASKILDLTLTGRDCGLDERAPMCGVPYHAVDGYIAKLIACGEKVAICEQLTDASASKGMVERDVVRVITPGTVIEDNILDNKTGNYLACVSVYNEKVGIAWCDVSTGEFNCIEIDNTKSMIEDMLSTIMPKEIITSDNSYEILNNLQLIKLGKLPKPYNYSDYAFKLHNAEQKLLSALNINTLQVYEINDKPSLITACGALVEYLSNMHKRALPHINKINVIKNNNFMFMDSNTRQNLELTSAIRDGKRQGSLLWVLDKTRTNMGARLLKKWIEQPLIDEKQINLRLDAVENLINNQAMYSILSEKLKNIRDIERMASKIACDTIMPRDMLSLAQSLSVLPEIKEVLNNAKCDYLINLNNNIDCLESICEMLTSAIAEDCPAIIRDGGYIKTGFNEELDNLNLAKSNANKWLADLEAKERQETGIKTLKIGYNKIFGYYIEVTKSLLDKVPFSYVRKQTLSNCERFMTDELKKIEDVVLGAKDKAIDLEFRIFTEIKNFLLKLVTTLQITANSVATCDVLLSLANVAKDYNYTKPTINNSIKTISISSGRHPVVEKIIGFNQFVANDTLLDNKDNRTMIITGPNMAGKSTYMRTVAIITLLAHIGSFVPAKHAEISITDRIFTRIGASDDLAFGQSTFMVEMIEVATILHNATDKSLIVLDEIGRGTSTCDGLAIAWAVMEYIAYNYKSKTLFSTHYHELNELEGLLEGVKNFRVMVTELNGNVVFSHKITRGGANKSFGVEVAKLAGLPETVIERANYLSKQLEQNEIVKDINSILLDNFDKVPNQNIQQLSLFSNGIAEEICDKIKTMDIDNLTPIQAMFELGNLKEMVRRKENGKNKPTRK